MNKVEQLKELNQLKIDGVVSQEEFNSMKKNIISGKETSNESDEEVCDDGGRWLEDNEIRMAELKKEIKDYKPSMWDNFCAGLSNFIPESNPEDEAAESAYRMSYNPWFKRSMKNFHNSKDS